MARAKAPAKRVAARTAVVEDKDGPSHIKVVAVEHAKRVRVSATITELASIELEREAIPDTKRALKGLADMMGDMVTSSHLEHRIEDRPGGSVNPGKASTSLRLGRAVAKAIMDLHAQPVAAKT